MFGLSGLSGLFGSFGLAGSSNWVSESDQRDKPDKRNKRDKPERPNEPERQEGLVCLVSLVHLVHLVCLVGGAAAEGGKRHGVRRNLSCRLQRLALRDRYEADFDTLLQGRGNSIEHHEGVPLVVCIFQPADD